MKRIINLKNNIKPKQIIRIIAVCVLLCICFALIKFIYIKILFIHPYRFKYDDNKKEFNEFSQYLIDDHRKNNYDFSYQIHWDKGGMHRYQPGKMEKTYISLPEDQQYNIEQIYENAVGQFPLTFIAVSENEVAYITMQGYLLIYSLDGRPAQSDNRKIIKIEKNWYLEEPKD